MNIPKNPSVVSPEQNIYEKEAVPSHHPHSSIESVVPAHSTLPKIDPQKIGFAGAAADATSISKHNIAKATATAKSSSVDQGPEIKITGKDLHECIEHVTGQLAPFFVACDEKNAAKIFVFSKNAKAIELHENTIASNAGDIAIEASHEKAKEFFVNHLTVIYGKAVIDSFYPEEKREEPLTLLQTHLLREQLNQFQKDVETACQGDPSKYESCLQSHLESLQQMQKAVATTFQNDGALKPQVDSLTNYLSKQLGASSETVQACLLSGLAISAVAAGAATGGIGLPAALHVAASGMTALSHGLGAGNAAAMIGSTAAATKAKTVAAGVARAAGGVIFAAGIGAGPGAVVGAVHGAAFHAIDQADGGNSNLLTSLRGGAIGDACAGMEIAFAAALLGPGALGVGMVTHPATWGVYGAAIGGALGATVAGVGAYNETPEGAAQMQNLRRALASLFSSEDSEALEDEEGMTADDPGSLHSGLHSVVPGSEHMASGAQIALIAAAGGVFAGAVWGIEAYLAGGLCSLAARSAATFAAAV